MARICSQCGNPPVAPRKGITLHYYFGSKEESFYCCGTDCADLLKAKKQAEGIGRPGVK